MNPAELETLIVRLVGDGSEYQAMLRQAQASTTEAAAHVETAAKRIENFGAGLKSFAQSAFGALASFGALGFLKGTLAAWEPMETGIIRMNAVLEANGRDVKATTASYLGFADAMTRVSTESTGDVMGVLRMAETYDLTGAAAQNAAKNAIALAAVNEGSAESYLRFTAALQKGNIEQAKHMARMIPQLRGIHDETELLTKANQLFVTGMKTAGALSETSGHQLVLAERAFKSLRREIGKVLDEALKPFYTGFREAMQWLAGTAKEVKMVIIAVTAVFAAMSGLPPLLKLIHFWMGFAFSGVGIVSGLVTLVGIGIGVWVSKVGGLGTAWRLVQGYFFQFWDAVKASVGTARDWGNAFLQNRFVQAFLKGLADAFIAIGIAVAFIVPLAVGLFNWFTKLAGVAGGWAESVAGPAGDVAEVLARVAGAVAAAYLAYKLLSFTVSAVNAVLTVLHVQQLLSLGLWLAKVAVLFVVKAALWALTATLTVLKAALWLVTAAFGALGVAAGLATVAVLAFVGVGLYVAFAGVVALVGGFLATLGSVRDLLASLPTTFGPLAALRDVFGEWWDIVQLIIRAVRVDMGLAWRIAQAGFQLAVLQIKQLFPDLWRFVKEGFVALWELVTTHLEVTFYEAAQRVRITLGRAWFALVPGGGEVFDRMERDANNAAAGMRRLSLQLAQVRLEAAGRNFGSGSWWDRFVGRPLREAELAGVRDQIASLRGEVVGREFWGDIAAGLRRRLPAAEGVGGQLGAAVARGAGKELKKLDAVLLNSAEGIATFLTYQESVRSGDFRAAAAPQAQGGLPGVPAGGDRGARIAQLLSESLVQLTLIAQRGGRIGLAGL